MNNAISLAALVPLYSSEPAAMTKRAAVRWVCHYRLGRNLARGSGNRAKRKINHSAAIAKATQP